MEGLIGEWYEARQAWQASSRAGEPARKQNRLADRVWNLGRAIASDVSLRSQVVALCGNGVEADTRLGAALVRERWDVAGATNTLVDIVEASGASLTRPVTMHSALAVETTPTARAAALCLYNIDRGTGNTVGEHLN